MARRTAIRARQPRVATARVVNGQIMTRAKFPDGTKLILQVDEPGPAVELTDEDVQAINVARASVRAGKGISLDKFRTFLRRL